MTPAARVVLTDKHDVCGVSLWAVRRNVPREKRTRLIDAIEEEARAARPPSDTDAQGTLLSCLSSRRRDSRKRSEGAQICARHPRAEIAFAQMTPSRGLSSCSASVRRLTLTSSSFAGVEFRQEGLAEEEGDRRARDLVRSTGRGRSRNGGWQARRSTVPNAAACIDRPGVQCGAAPPGGNKSGRRRRTSRTGAENVPSHPVFACPEWRPMAQAPWASGDDPFSRPRGHRDPRRALPNTQDDDRVC